MPRQPATIRDNEWRALIRTALAERPVVSLTDWRHARSASSRAREHLREAERLIESDSSPYAAIRSLEAALSLDPGLAEGHHRLGQLWNEFEDWDKAFAAFSRAVELDPNDPEKLIDLALAGPPDRFVSTIEAALDAAPKFALGHMWLGAYWSNLGQHEAALPEFRRAVELGIDPYDFGHLEGWARDSALALRSAIESSRNGPDLYFLGLAFRFERRFDLALALLQNAAEANPGLVAPRLALAETLRDCGKTPEALSVLRQVIEVWPENTAARTMRVLFFRGDILPEDRIEDCRIAVGGPQADISRRTRDWANDYQHLRPVHKIDLLRRYSLTLCAHGRAEEAAPVIARSLRLQFGKVGFQLPAEGIARELQYLTNNIAQLNVERYHDAVSNPVLEDISVDFSEIAKVIAERFPPESRGTFIQRFMDAAREASASRNALESGGEEARVEPVSSAYSSESSLRTLPARAPEIYELRVADEATGKKERLPDFLRRVWGEWMDGKTLTRAKLRELDPSADRAIENWLSRKALPSDILLPTRKELNDFAIQDEEAVRRARRLVAAANRRRTP